MMNNNEGILGIFRIIMCLSVFLVSPIITAFSRQKRCTGCLLRMPPWQSLTSETSRILTPGDDIVDGGDHEYGLAVFMLMFITILAIKIRGKQSKIVLICSNDH